MNDIQILADLSYTVGKLEGLVQVSDEDGDWSDSALECLEELNRVLGIIQRRCTGEEADCGTDHH